MPKILNHTICCYRDLTSTDKGKVNVSNTFQLCEPIKTKDDVDTLLNWLDEILVNTVMVNYPYPTSFLVPLPGHPVREICQDIDSVNQTTNDGVIEAIAKGLQVYTNYTGATKCNNILETASPSLGEQGWNFQVSYNIPAQITFELCIFLGLYRYDHANMLN